MTRLKLRHVHAFVDRHGRVRHYFRRRGAKQVPLLGLPGSAEFMAAYQAALAGVTAPAVEIGANRTKPGTVDAAVVGYYTSLTFRALAPGTQSMRRAIYERFRADHGAKQIATLPPKFIVHILSRMKPIAARNWLKALRALLAFAVAEGFRADNPAAGIKLGKHEAKSHHAWTDDEIARYEARYPIGTKERLAFALLLHTGQRRGDIVRMGPQHVRAGPDGPELFVEQEKTGNKLLLPVRPGLQAVLDVWPAKHLTFLTTKTGKPYGGNDFSDQFRDWCDAAGLPKACTAHGLRHAAGRLMAERSCTVHEIAAVLGHKSLRMAEHYTKAAEQAKLARAAARRMRSNDERDSGKPLGRFAKNGT